MRVLCLVESMVVGYSRRVQVSNLQGGGSQLTGQTEFLGCRTKWRKYDFSFLLEV